ncbi:polysaccharide biosynthesis protein [Ornithinimicrobium cryptoxanthini]|uniref:Polysaccharide biosynthesis protein n=1 Tax=Ornithinimicrobium cryptoxanthini TaxID=2934161 RepID=A0ABY4YH55_9MICO|nr:nucleoside-diphosphate sugar epimerase/dehydratase [Ornithinimicrobium cryptoxanthini]USQ76106.1 polysaccharide biosynthesis protein [Ornithinimicrobium cryptoxanthini]
MATLWTRLELDGNVLTHLNTWLVALGAASLHAVVGTVLGPYMVRHVRGSFEEVISVVRAAAITGLVLLVVAFAFNTIFLPRSVPFLATALAIVLMLAARFTIRTYRSRRAGTRETAGRVIVYGAGLAGRRLAYNMLHDDRSELVPVAYIDDDRHKRRLRVEGVPVLGTGADLVAVAERTNATHVVVAIPRVDSELLRETRELAEEAGLKIKVLPPLNEWVRTADPQGSDLRDLNLEDLLGRHAVALDQDAISAHLTGRVVLVTGAGGSIGSELCRQIAKFNPGRLVMLDRDESTLHATQLSITGRALLDADDLILVNIRDADTLRAHFAEFKPEIVFHAAALKHLSLLERYPTEAWQTNVLGTLNVLQAATEAGVDTFVNISTDKAASPTSVLGYSKRIAERLTAHYAQTAPGRYVSVRFGNVLGSRGSVIPAFTEQIRRGGPVTVTDPDVERYFMLIPEACQLVMQAGAIGHDGQAMVLDMGTPVKIVDVAHELIALSGKDVEIQFTGLRPGEKLTEVLFMTDEAHQPTSHPMMAAVDVPSLDPHFLMRLQVQDPASVRRAFEACGNSDTSAAAM